ncbi:MAG: hypothetical protein R3F29_10815 [Planctomycetota bacterium]
MCTKASILFVILLSMLSAGLSAQVTVKRGAVVYTGSASNTTAPATIDEKEVRESTPEWKKMQDEDIDPDSAHGKQLIVKMNQRIREAVKSVASAESRDMVTRKQDMKDDQGREVVDLTQKVVDKINE